MGYLDKVTLPEDRKKKQGGYLGSVILPTPERQEEVKKEWASIKNTPPPPVVPSPEPKKSSFLGFAKKVGDKVENTTYKIGQYAEESDYKPNLFKDTLKEIGSLEHLPLGVGEIISQARKDPETVASLVPKDVVKGLIDTGKELVKYPVKAVLSTGAGLLSPILKNKGAVEVDIPGLGRVTSVSKDVIDQIDAGTPPWLAITQSVPEAIFEGLFIAGMAQKLTSPRPTVVAKGEIPKDFKITTKEKPKSFRHYEEPQYFQPLPPGALETIAGQKGFQLGSKYNPALPTYFKMTGQANGVIQGSVVQVKPSYWDVFMGKFKGDLSRVPPEMLETHHVQETSIQEIANAKPTTAKTPTVPVVTPKAPTMGIVETLKSLETQPNTVVTKDPEVGRVVEVPLSDEIVEPEIKTPTTRETNLMEDLPEKVVAEATEYWDENVAPRYGELDMELNQTQQALKTASVEERPALEAKVDQLNQALTKMEEDFMSKYREVSEVKDTVNRIESKLTPIREIDGQKVKVPTYKTAYSDRRFVGKYKGKPYTTDTVIIEFEDLGFDKTNPGPVSEAVDEVVQKAVKGSRDLGSPVEFVSSKMMNNVVFKLGKEEVTLDAKYYNYLTKKYKDLVLKGTGPRNPIAIYDGKTLKGVVMPITEKLKGTGVKNTKLKTPSGSAMAQYSPEDVPKITKEFGGIKNIKPVEMPELVRLTRELMGKFPEVVRRTGDAAGRFYHDGRIKLISSLFTKEMADVNMAGRVLAHEIGHLIDWLPDHTLKRGNLLGRLESLRGFLSSTFNTKTGEALDLKAVRSESIKEVLKKNEETFSNYIKDKDLREKLKPEIDKVYNRKIDESGAIKDVTIRKELLAVTRYWHPYDPKAVSKSYLNYRESSKELYADSLSMLLTDPAMLEKMAPTFYKEFFNALDKKPEVKRAFFELQELLNGTPEGIFKARMNDILAGFRRAEDIQRGFREKKELSDKSLWFRLRTQVDDINYPILKKQAEAEARGKIFPDEENLKFVLEELSLADNENFILVEKIENEIVNPLKEAGISIEDAGQYLLLERIGADRAELANPYGFTPENAAKQLEYLEETLGAEKFKILEEKMQSFHEIVFPTVEEAVRVGSYNEDVYLEKILPNKDKYAAFQVVDYMQDHMPATIKAQVGTLKEVANPLNSTILKTVALNRLNAYQRAKNATIKMLQKNFPGEISETRRISTDGKLSIFKVEDGKGGLEVLENGRMASYDVDPYIAESFNKLSVGELNVMVELSDKLNNKFFKPVVTTFNLGFILGTNPIRDFMRNYKLIPNATIRTLFVEYIKAFPDAMKYAAGDLTEFTRELANMKAINTPMTDYRYEDVDAQFASILEKHGIIKPNEKEWSNATLEKVRKSVIVPATQLLNAIKYVANVTESVSKIAGAKTRMKGGESGSGLAYNVRNYTGTPNFRVRGSDTRTTNAIWVFSNILKEGIKSDVRFATNPNTRSGYWWKTVKVSLLPKFLMFLATAGVLGKELQEAMNKATEYDKTNYTIIPLGTTENGKAVYIRIPNDESGRLVSALFWKIANALKDGGSGEDLQQVFALGAGQFPGLAPAVKIPAAWTLYLAGKNPYDPFRGRNIIDDTTWEAGGGAALKKMAFWTLNSLGLTKISTYDDATKTWVESVVELAPWLSSMIKITDYGLQEKYGEPGRERKQQEAKQNLLERDLVNKYVKLADKNPDLTVQYLKELAQEVNDNTVIEFNKDRANSLVNKYAKALTQGTGARERVIQNAGSNAQKAAILKAVREDMGDGEFKEYLGGLVKTKTISEAVVELLYDKEGNPISKTESGKVMALVNTLLGVKTASAAGNEDDVFISTEKKQSFFSKLIKGSVTSYTRVDQQEAGKILAERGESVPAEVTMYNPTKAQTDKTPTIMASGKKIYSGAIATSDYDMPFGTKVYIPELDQVFTVEDRMNRRYEPHKYGKTVFDILETKANKAAVKKAMEFGRQQLSFVVVGHDGR